MSETTFPQIAAVINQTAEAFEVFKAKHDQRLDGLQDRLEQIEAKQTSPGLTGRPQKKTAAPPDACITDSGAVIPILRKGSDFAAFYAQPDQEPMRMGEFMRGVAGMKTTDVARKALSVGVDASGGYAVPTVLMPEILDAMVPVSALLQAGAGVVDVSQNEGKTFNMAAIETIPTAAWRSENGAVAESDPALRLVSATPRSLAFYFKISRELMVDALNLDAALRTVIVQAFAKELDRVGLRGTGTAPQPRGILNTAGIQAVANGANGASLATTAYANFVSAVQALLAVDAPMPSAAIMAPRSLTTLGGLLDTTNQPRQRPEMLAPLKFLVTSQVPVNLTVGASTDCSELYLGDFTKVAFVMRERPTIMLAKEAFATTGQVAFVCHVRADVVVQYPSAFAVVTGVRA